MGILEKYLIMASFDEIINIISVNKKVFTPNLTSKLSFEVAIKKIKNNSKVLDLGCGTGIIGVGVFKNKKNVKLYCSDSSDYACKLTKRNFKKNLITAKIKKGNLFSPWKNEKFDYIINDVSGISSLIAKKSPWFNKFVPCDSGKDGTKLTIKIISQAKKYLNSKGVLQLPMISLSNEKKILKEAKKIFKKVEIIDKADWFLPYEMQNLHRYLENLKSKGYINFIKKFGRIICTTSIITCAIIKR